MDDDSTDALNPNYFSEAVRWETDVIRSVKRSRNIAWIVACASIALCGLSMISLAMLLPLKSFEPYVIEVDKTTGFMEIKRPLAEGPLTQNEAITRMYLVRFLRVREGYDSSTVKDNYELAHLLSTDKAQRDLTNLYGPANPENPVTRYGREAKVSVLIKSVQLTSDNSALIRFSTEETGRMNVVLQHWVALLRFRYIATPMANSWRFENPLGFQVTEYHREQENVPSGSSSGAIQ